MFKNSIIFLTKFHRRNIFYSIIKKAIFSNEFSLDKEWHERHDNMKKLSLGGGYEWIASVQKKFIGGGKARLVLFIYLINFLVLLMWMLLLVELRKRIKLMIYYN